MSVEENKKVARMYHDLNPDDVEKILTPDFIGRHPTGFTWNRDAHKPYCSSRRGTKDIIHQQIAEGEWVATRFTRPDMMYQDRQGDFEIMHFKRFEDGKIAEIWELGHVRESL